jgi:cytochrome c biogenesis protein CcmG, thiol:disulfide interchange protein DsbE
MVTSRRLLVFLCLLPVCFAQHTPRRLADIPILTSEGKTIHVSQYRGKVLMIEMNLTDCPECLVTLQFMGDLQKEYGARGFQAIGIALDPSMQTVKPFAERYRFPFPFGFLEKDPAIKFLDLNATAHPIVPYLLFVDWMGSVRFQYAGNDPIWGQGQKGLRTIADGLLRQAEEKKGAQYETKPAGK